MRHSSITAHRGFGLVPTNKLLAEDNKTLPESRAYLPADRTAAHVKASWCAGKSEFSHTPVPEARCITPGTGGDCAVIRA